MAKLSPLYNEVTLDDSGNPASGWKVYTYVAGSSTPVNTYTSEDGDVAQENPVILNARGEPDSPIWLTEGVSYKFVLTDSDGVVKRTLDNVTGIGDNSIALDQWVVGPEPTYVSATSFTLVGDQTSAFHVGRRVKCATTGGTVYGTIEGSAYTTLTTITVDLDSGSLDSGLSAVSLGLITRNNTSLPTASDELPIISNADDFTKKIRLSAEEVTTGTTRVLTAPDLDGRIAIAPFMRGYIAGLVLSNNSTDSEHDIDIAPGVCVDSTSAYFLRLPSTLTKRLDAEWAVGSGNGGLDTGSVANSTWYHVWLIRADDDGSIDALFSTSASAPTMPSGYTAKRLIGSVRTDSSGNIEAFKAYETGGGGIEVLWSSPTLDIDLTSTLGTTARLDTIHVPTGYSVKALLNVRSSDGSGAFSIYISCPDVEDVAPSGGNAPLGTLQGQSGGIAAGQAVVRTNTSGQIRSRSSLSTVDNYYVATMGYEWSRR